MMRLVEMDRRGYGASPDSPAATTSKTPPTSPACPGDAAHLVGHCYGGAAAMVAAARIGATLPGVPGYYPHVQHPGIVSAALDRFWSQPGNPHQPRADRRGWPGDRVRRLHPGRR